MTKKEFAEVFLKEYCSKHWELALKDDFDEVVDFIWDLILKPKVYKDVALHHQGRYSVIPLTKDIEIKISHDLLQSWYETYPKDFLEMEIKKAKSWILCNPQKAPKSQWGRFFNSWFNRAWETYRKTLKSNPVKMTEQDMEELLKGK